jgi:DNA-binding MarR family transcriptional regulator
MKSDDQAASMALSALFLDIFRANGRLIAAGDQLIAPLGLTSARWQVLGAVAMARTPQPVAHLARDMGLARQGVQRIVNELADEDFVAFEDNPHHRRAKLVRLTPRGQEVMSAAHKLQRPWVDILAAGLDASKIAIAAEVLEALRNRLEDGTNPEGADQD